MVRSVKFKKWLNDVFVFVLNKKKTTTSTTYSFQAKGLAKGGKNLCIVHIKEMNEKNAWMKKTNEKKVDEIG